MTSGGTPPTSQTADERVARIGSVSTLTAAIIAAVTAVAVGVLSGVISGNYAKSSAHDQATAAAVQARHDYLRGQRQGADATFLDLADKVEAALLAFDGQVAQDLTRTTPDPALPTFTPSVTFDAAQQALHRQLETITILGSASTYGDAQKLADHFDANIIKVRGVELHAVNGSASETLFGMLSEFGPQYSQDVSTFVYDAKVDIQSN